MTMPTRSLPLVALVLVSAILAFNLRVVAGGKTWADVRYHTEIAPPRLAAAEAVQSLALPTWWEGTALGVPLAGEPTHGAMYPVTWIAATPRALDLVAIAHLIWAALGVALWARRRGGASDQGAVVAGILAVTSGLVASMAIRGALPAIAHLPWIGVTAAWLADATERRERARAAAALGGLLGLIALTGVLAALVDAVVIAAVLAARRRALGSVVAAIAGGLAIGLPQWLPAFLQLGASAGAEVTAIPLGRLVELVVPGSFGAADPERAVAGLVGAHPWAPSLFVGAPLLALAAVRTPSRRVLAVIGALAALALIVGRGGWPAWLGAPEVHLAALVIVLAARAGAGLDALARGERRALVALGVGAACAGVALAAFGALRSRHPEAADAIDRALFDGGLGLVCMIAALAIVWRVWRRRRSSEPAKAGAWESPLVFALLVLPSVGAAPSLAPLAERSIVDEPPAWARAVMARTAHRAPVRVYRPVFMHDQPERLEDAIGTFAGASGWRWRVASARSESPARPRLHDRVWLAAAREGGALLDRYSIELAILPETLIVPRKLEPLGTRGRWTLAELPVAPHASVLRGALWSVAHDNALALLFPAGGHSGVLRGTVVLQGAGPARTDRGPPLPCKIERWSAGAIDLACTTDLDGYAVVSSTSAAGWEVTVDGEDAPWLTADVMRRAVAIGAGSHRVSWRYAAPGMAIGLVAAALGIAGLGALVLVTRRHVPERERA